MLSLKTQIVWCTRIQLGLVLGVIKVSVGAFVFAGYEPLVKKLHGLDDQIAQTRRQLESNKTQMHQMPAVESDINRLRADLEDVQKLSANPEIGQFMSQIKQASQEAGLRKFEVSLPGAQRRSEQPVSLKFDGDFYSAFSFLCRAEQMKHLTRITNLTIHGADLNRGQVEVNVAMNLYFSEG